MEKLTQRVILTGLEISLSVTHTLRVEMCGWHPVVAAGRPGWPEGGETGVWSKPGKRFSVLVPR